MVACLIVFSIVDLLGVSMLIPLLSVAIPGERHGKVQKLLEPIFAWLHLHPNIEGLLLVFVALIALKTLLSVLLMHISGNLVSDLTQSLRQRLSFGILRAQWSWLLRHPVNRLANIASRDANRVGQMFHASANSLAMGLQLIAYIGLALFFSWQAAILAIGLGGIVPVGVSKDYWSQ